MGLLGCGLSTTIESTTSTNSSSSTISDESTSVNTTYSDTTTTYINQDTTTLITTEVTVPTTITTATTSVIETTTTVTYDRYQDIYLYSINDFHGGAYLNIEAFANINAEIKYMKNNNDHVIAVANGDMLQGTAISNYYYGKPLIEAMNIGGWDGFTIGNHEFDWGIEKIADYKDGNLENGEADFPILAANIVYTDTAQPLDFTIPYFISETNGVRVGVIGIIGNVMGSIAASRVENITFLDPIDVIEDNAYHLRTMEDVDIIAVYIHYGSSINYSIAELSGDARVDIVFNGHSHQTESGVIERAGSDLYFAQTSANQYSLISRMLINYDSLTKEIQSVTIKTHNLSSLSNYDNETSAMLQVFANETNYVSYVSQILAYAEDDFDRYDLGQWGASVIRDYLGIDIGAVNYGGFRVTMEQGNVMMGDIITIYPFDNVIKTSRMTGMQIRDFYLENPYDTVFDDSLSTDGYTVYIDGSPIVLDQYYTVGAVDYIFDKTDYDFLLGEDITYTGKFMRDLLVEDLLNSTSPFNPYNGSSHPNN
jgi:2',3'-cyclic-nucleotide 2'-phosphodiesterase (5'-nucleotidase family)